MTEEQRDMLDALLDLDHGLTPWEIGFIDKLDKWTGSLVGNQPSKLEQIYEQRIIQGDLAAQA